MSAVNPEFSAEYYAPLYMHYGELEGDVFSPAALGVPATDQYVSNEPAQVLSLDEARQRARNKQDSLLPAEVEDESEVAVSVVKEENDKTPQVVDRICRATDSFDLIQQARQLTAGVYLGRGFIQAEEVSRDGVIADDPAHEHSTYYVKRNAMDDGSVQVVATLRAIHWNPDRGEASFPLWEHKDELYSEALRKIEEVGGLEKCVEISAFVKDRELDVDGMAALELNRSVFQDSLMELPNDDKRNSEEVYLMAANPVLFEMLSDNFNGYVDRIGPNLDYPGQYAVPAMIRPRAAVVDALNRLADGTLENEQLKAVVGFMIEGLDESKVKPDVADALRRARSANVFGVGNGDESQGGDNSVVQEAEPEHVDDDVARSSAVREHLRNRKPEYAFGATLLGYTALRTIGVAKGVSPDTDVDWRVFLGIELASTMPYSLAMGDMVRAAAHPDEYTTRRQIGAAVVAGVSFLSPYAYVFAEGEGMSNASLVGVGAWCLAASAMAVKKIRRIRKNRATA